MEAVRFENAIFSYNDDGRDPAVNGVTLSIGKGEFVAILGRNGSGKSTLAKLINALLLPTEGKVYTCGMDTSDEKLSFEIRKRAGMVFQNPDNQTVRLHRRGRRGIRAGEHRACARGDRPAHRFCTRRGGDAGIPPCHALPPFGRTETAHCDRGRPRHSSRDHDSRRIHPPCSIRAVGGR